MIRIAYISRVHSFMTQASMGRNLSFIYSAEFELKVLDVTMRSYFVLKTILG